MYNRYKVDVESVNTRDQAKDLVKRAEDSGSSALDVGKVEFISRSGADELLYQAEKRDIEVVGESGDVEGMFEVIDDHGSSLTA